MSYMSPTIEAIGHGTIWHGIIRAAKYPRVLAGWGTWTSEGDSLQMQHLAIILKESRAEFDDSAGNSVEVFHLLGAEVVKHLAQTLDEAVLLIAVLVCLAELQQNLVICDGKRTGVSDKRRRGDESDPRLAKMLMLPEELTRSVDRVQVLELAALGARLTSEFIRTEGLLGVNLVAVSQRLQPPGHRVLVPRVEPIGAEITEGTLVGLESRLRHCCRRINDLLQC